MDDSNSPELHPVQRTLERIPSCICPSLSPEGSGFHRSGTGKLHECFQTTGILGVGVFLLLSKVYTYREPAPSPQILFLENFPGSLEWP